jgi:hypothetical protein
MDGHHPTRDLLEGYALGTLDEGERAAMEAHVGACPSCRRELAELAEAAHALPAALAAASPLELPDELERRVLDRIEQERTADRPAAVDRADRARSRHRAAPLRWRPGLALGAIALVLAAALGVWNTQLSSALSDERSQRKQLAKLVGRQELVLEVVDSEHTIRRVLLPAARRRSSAYGKLFTRPDLPQAVAMAGRLRQPPQGRTYQLWLTRGRQVRRAGTLQVNADGFGLLVLRAPRPGPAYREARVTLQPPEARRPGTPVLIWRG